METYYGPGGPPVQNTVAPSRFITDALGLAQAISLVKHGSPVQTAAALPNPSAGQLSGAPAQGANTDAKAKSFSDQLKAIPAPVWILGGVGLYLLVRR